MSVCIRSGHVLSTFSLRFHLCSCYVLAIVCLPSVYGSVSVTESVLSFLWSCSFAYVLPELLAMFCLPSVYDSVYVMSMFSLRSGHILSSFSLRFCLCSIFRPVAVFCQLHSCYVSSLFRLRLSSTVLSRFRLYLHLHDVSNNDDDDDIQAKMGQGCYMGHMGQGCHMYDVASDDDDDDIQAKMGQGSGQGCYLSRLDCPGMPPTQPAV